MWKDLPDVISATLLESTNRLLRQAGFSVPSSIQPLPSGGNNRVFRVESGGNALLLKKYFHHPDDRRDRLAVEFSFSTFAWNHGVRMIPEPYARDEQHLLGLYEFIPGRKLVPDELTASAVSDALDFFVAVNRHKQQDEAERLPCASEACFELTEHLECVQGRMERLLAVDDESAVGRDLGRFVRNDLCVVWNQIVRRVYQQYVKQGRDGAAALSPDKQCLSPSDFGFHNALLGSDGHLRFFDFEYAGWDDPAKTVCDFFCQPAIPVPLESYGVVAERVAEVCNDAALPQRIDLLFPVYQVKWCCILLNDFLPWGGRRRSFVGGTTAQEEQKARQLRKARQALQNLVSTGVARIA